MLIDWRNDPSTTPAIQQQLDYLLEGMPSSVPLREFVADLFDIPFAEVSSLISLYQSTTPTYSRQDRPRLALSTTIATPATSTQEPAQNIDLDSPTTSEFGACLYAEESDDACSISDTDSDDSPASLGACLFAEEPDDACSISDTDSDDSLPSLSAPDVSPGMRRRRTSSSASYNRESRRLRADLSLQGFPAYIPMTDTELRAVAAGRMSLPQTADFRLFMAMMEGWEWDFALEDDEDGANWREEIYAAEDETYWREQGYGSQLVPTVHLSYEASIEMWDHVLGFPRLAERWWDEGDE